MKLLIIRPQPGADATAKRATALGLEPHILPLFSIQKLDWEPSEAANHDALLITSANAILDGGSGLDSLKSLPVYAVGAASACVAADAGFTVAATGEGDAAAILGMAHNDGRSRLLWLTGEHHTGLQPPSGMNITRQTVYRSAKLPALEDFAGLLAAPATVMLHSPRAARYFVDLCDQKEIGRAQIQIAALSSNVAEEAGGGWKAKVIADEPSDDALLRAIATSFTSPLRSPPSRTNRVCK